MSDWSALRTAYGAADDVPRMLAAVSDRPDDESAWFDLWSHLCHQGTVYTASYAALPSLADLAERATPAPFVQPVALAAMIVASTDRYDEAAAVDPVREHPDAVARLAAVASRGLATAVGDDRDLTAAVQCVAAFEGVPVWPVDLDRLHGFTDVECGSCGADLEVEPDDADAADLATLDAGSRRVHELLGVRPALAERFRRLAGTVTCPECGTVSHVVSR